MQTTVCLVALAALLAYADAKKHFHPERQCVTASNNASADLDNLIKCHNPTYRPDKHHAARIAKLNKCRQEALNQDPDSNHTVGLNHFCLWTDQEFNNSLNHVIGPAAADGSALRGLQVSETDFRATTTLPVNFSWVSNGAVSSVKNQGQCGSCYTFAAVGAVEGAYKIKYGILYDLSPQQYVDCSYGYSAQMWTSTTCSGSTCVTTSYDKWVVGSGGNGGCNGGDYCATWGYNNKTAQGTNLLSCYPYVSDATYKNGACAYKSGCAASVRVSNYVRISSGDEATMQKVIATVGPIACSLDANPLQTYTGGILSGSSSNLNHAVLVVGYGTTSSGQDYWLVKNSWGSGWGVNGYFYLQRNSNTLGIATWCAYPIVV